MKKKFEVKFDENVCKGCGLCKSACPMKIIDIDETRINKKGFNPAFIKDQDKCIGCTSCALMCPDCAITIKEREEENA